MKLDWENTHLYMSYTKNSLVVKLFLTRCRVVKKEGPGGRPRRADIGPLPVTPGAFHPRGDGRSHIAN